MTLPPPRSTLFPYTTLFRSADGWFIVFDTLTLADDRLEAFYDNPNALRDYFRSSANVRVRSEERFSRNAETDLVCRLLLEKKNTQLTTLYISPGDVSFAVTA